MCKIFSELLLFFQFCSNFFSCVEVLAPWTLICLFLLSWFVIGVGNGFQGLFLILCLGMSHSWWSEMIWGTRDQTWVNTGKALPTNDHLSLWPYIFLCFFSPLQLSWLSKSFSNDSVLNIYPLVLFPFCGIYNFRSKTNSLLIFVSWLFILRQHPCFSVQKLCFFVQVSLLVELKNHIWWLWWNSGWQHIRQTSFPQLYYLSRPSLVLWVKFCEWY